MFSSEGGGCIEISVTGKYSEASGYFSGEAQATLLHDPKVDAEDLKMVRDAITGLGLKEGKLPELNMCTKGII